MSEVIQERETEPVTAMQRRPEPPSPMEILQTVAARGGTGVEMEAVVNLILRLKAVDAEAAYSADFKACQAEMPTVVKGTKNKGTDTMYASFEDIQEKCKPIYTKFGFSCSYTEEPASVATLRRTVIEVRHEKGHSTRRYIELPVDGVSAKGNPIGAMNPVQAYVSTHSYGQRKLFCMAWNITLAGEDHDGNTGPVGPLTDDELKEIYRLFELNQNTAGVSPMKLKPFLEWVGKFPGMPGPVENIESIPSACFRKIKSAMENRLKGKNGGK